MENLLMGLIEDPDFIHAIWDTLVFAISTVFLELALGMIVALIVNANFTGRSLMRAIILIPWAIPTAVSSQMWAFMFQPNRTGLFINLIPVFASVMAVALLDETLKNYHFLGMGLIAGGMFLFNRPRAS